MTEGDVVRGKQQDRYLELWYKYKVTNKNSIEVFRELLAEPDYETFSLLKAKMVAQRHEFTDEFIANEIRPYKHGPKKVSYYKQLLMDTFWNAEEFARKLQP